jgi:hypothetical protein
MGGARRAVQSVRVVGEHFMQPQKGRRTELDLNCGKAFDNCQLAHHTWGNAQEGRDCWALEVCGSVCAGAVPSARSIAAVGWSVGRWRGRGTIVS